MMIEVDPAALDGLVRSWLKEQIRGIEINAAARYVHPDDAKMYKKDIKALNWVLEYIGEGE